MAAVATTRGSRTDGGKIRRVWRAVLARIRQMDLAEAGLYIDLVLGCKTKGTKPDNKLCPA